MTLISRFALRHPPRAASSALPLLLAPRLYSPQTSSTAPHRIPLVRTMSSASQAASEKDLQTLQNYTACDIADGLLKLKVPNAGFIPDLILQTSGSSQSGSKITIAPASTVLFTSKDGNIPAHVSPSNIPTGKHWVDLTQSGTIVVMSQPAGQKCSVLGGIMAQRMMVLRARGVIVCGRCRDIVELENTGLPIWSKGRSIVGSGAEAKPYNVQVPLNIDGTIINPGDLVFSDSTNGVAIIPKEKLSELISLLPRLVEADDRVKVDINLGLTVREAFTKHRG